ncbi:RNA polymerase II transcription factor B subunit 4 isoform X1 [Cinnamomum micranthum f. kanehirae]|uniref:General transcription and DNA repair factor IIH subunit TFB4 n=1 Tax=Cinnamomum micranthum f. kanehirae TaxID=337451 RepID=A0A3S3NFF7_9MAGN|nr:RNA polymerase II transcription factor B subunit 4 isoform X1 [Cinnamomum micranthum f. kanehirae]
MQLLCNSCRVFLLMASTASKLYSDDVSLVVVLLDTNPFFWAIAKNSNNSNPNLSFSKFLNHVLPFLNSILLLNQINQVVVIATGVNSCGYIYDSSSSPPASAAKSENGNMPGIFSRVIQKLEEFVIKDQQLSKDESVVGNPSSLLSGSLSLALCYIQRVFRSGPLHPHPRVPIDSCVVGAQHSAFLQQASYITGGVYIKPQHLDGLFQYLTMVFATDLQSRSFLQLPRPVGVDFRASYVPHS